MLNNEFTPPPDLESADAPACQRPDLAEPTPETAPPLVIVEYRNRGIPSWLMVPLTVLSVVFGIWSYGRFGSEHFWPPRSHRSTAPRAPVTADRSTLATSTPPTAANTMPEPVRRSSAEPGSATPALALTRGSSLGPPSSSPDAMALGAKIAEGELAYEDVAPASREEPHLPAPLPVPASDRGSLPAERAAGTMSAPLTVTDEGSPAGTPPVVPPTSEEPVPTAEPESAPPVVTDEEVERDILRESEARKAELDLMRRAKVDARRIAEREAARNAFEQRVSFHRELRSILRGGGAPAGHQIDELCDQFGREVAPEHTDAVRRQLMRLPARAERAHRVALMRNLGVPEPAILDDLAASLGRQLINARHGVRNSDELRIRAAQQLLSFPLTSSLAADADRPR